MSAAITGAVQADSKKLFEHWFFTFIAAEFLLIAILGFAPNSLAIINGTKVNPPLLIHAHAALMFSWMFAFLAQACLISAGRVREHIQAGRVLLWIGLLVAISFTYLSLFWPGDGFGRIQIPMAAERIGLFSLFFVLCSLFFVLCSWLSRSLIGHAIRNRISATSCLRLSFQLMLD